MSHNTAVTATSVKRNNNNNEPATAREQVRKSEKVLLFLRETIAFDSNISSTQGASKCDNNKPQHHTQVIGHIPQNHNANSAK